MTIKHRDSISDSSDCDMNGGRLGPPFPTAVAASHAVPGKIST